MDKLKIDIQHNLHKLKDECATMVDQLNKLIQLSTNHVNDITTLDSKETRLYSNYLSMVSHFEHSSYLKLTEWNIDLEEFLNEKNPPKLQRLPAPTGENMSRSFSSRRGSNVSSFSSTSSQHELSLTTEQVVKVCETTPTIRLDETALTKGDSNSEGLLFKLDDSMEHKDILSQSLAVVESCSLIRDEDDEISVPMQPVVVIQSESTTDETSLVKINRNSDSSNGGLLVEGINQITEDFIQLTINTDSSSSRSLDDNDILTNYEKETTKTNSNDAISRHCIQSPTCVDVEEYDESEKIKGIFKHPGSCTTKDQNKFLSTAQEKQILMEESSTSLPVDKTEKLKKYSSNTFISEISSTCDHFETAASCLDTSFEGSEYFDLSNSSCDEPEQVKSDHKATSHLTTTAMQQKKSDLAKELHVYSRRVYQRNAAKYKNVPMPDISLRPAGYSSTSSSSGNTDGASVQVPNRHLFYKDVPVANAVNVKPEKKKKQYSSVASKKQIVAIRERVPPKVGDKCMIGYVQSPAEFYIQVCDDNCSFIDVISIQLAELNNSQAHYVSKADAKYKLANFCCCFLNDYWYRVEILDWMLDKGAHEDRVLLQLVDYGDKYKIHYQYLHPLLPELCNLPRMAQLCHLGYLYPPGSSKNTRLTEWQDEHVENFLSVLGDLNQALFKISHVDYDRTRKSFEIDLIDCNQDSDMKSLGDTLVESGVAVQIVDNMAEVMMTASANQIWTAHGMGGINTNMSLEQKMEKYFAQNTTREEENVNVAVLEYDPRDEALTCRNLRPDGTCFKGKSCKFLHVPLTNGFTRDREPIHTRTLVEDPLPCVGDEVMLIITHVVDINRFYAQIKREHDGALHTFIKSMNYPDVIKGYQPLSRPPALNQIVIALHWNGNWYRASVINILQIPDNNQEITVEVFIVDFGDVLRVSMSELREITPELLQLSFQAYECRLCNVSHKEGADPVEETRQFESRYLCQTFKATIIAVPGYLGVLLKNNRGEDIGLKLINDGIGQSNPMPNRLIPLDERLLIE